MVAIKLERKPHEYALFIVVVIATLGNYLVSFIALAFLYLIFFPGWDTMIEGTYGYRMQCTNMNIALMWPWLRAMMVITMWQMFGRR